VVAFSANMKPQEKQLKSFLYQNLYFHENVLVRREAGEIIVTQLFAAYLDNPSLLPAEWAERAQVTRAAERARLIADFLAGMTDTYALRDYKRLFDKVAACFSLGASSEKWEPVFG